MGGTIAAALASPHVASAGQHAAHAQAVAAAREGAAAGAAPAPAPAAPLPRALDDHERATLAVLGEQLVPGSTAAGVPALIDRVLAVEPPEVLRRFRNALGAFEREARARHAKPWLALSGEERTALVEVAAAGAPAVTPPAGWRPGEPVLRPAPTTPAPPPTLRDHHDHLRDAVARAYYATEVGAKELGWTGDEVFEGLPECKR
jgi:hypothetical protein